MGALEAGGGVGTAGLAGMWRGVYRKAAAAAEARLQTLLAEHQFHLHGRRALTVVVDGGGAALAPGDGPDVELPWAYVLEGWALYADAAGSAVLDLETTDYATFPAAASICGGSPPTLAGAQKARSDDVSAWTTTALPRGTVLRPVLVSASGVTRLALTLWVRAV